MEHHVKTAELLTYLLENRFTIFRFKFGLDPLLGLIPWLGDIVALMLSLYLLWIASQLKLPDHKFREMLRNIILDFLIGILPFVGTIGDFLFRSNSRNLTILREHMLVKEAVIVKQYPATKFQISEVKKHIKGKIFTFSSILCFLFCGYHKFCIVNSNSPLSYILSFIFKFPFLSTSRQS